MLIGIDGYNLVIPKGTGIATYGLALADTLKAGGYETMGVFGLDVGKVDEAMCEVLFFDRFARPDTQCNRKQARRYTRRMRLRAMLPLASRAAEIPLTGQVVTSGLSERFPAFDRLASAANLFDLAHRYFKAHGRFLRLRVPNPPAVMHWTYPVPVRLEGSRNLYTVHDLLPIKLPYTTLDDKTYHERMLRRCAIEADRIVTVSETSRRDIVDFLGLDAAQVTNTYQSTLLPSDVTSATPQENARIVSGAFGLEADGYFLFFGSIEPKKNLGRLIEAFLSTGTEAPLVVVSGGGWQNDAENALLAQASTQAEGALDSPRVRRMDYLSRNMLLRLVAGARGVIFPSLYEGFGLPVLEALQLGAPVLCSNTSSLPEVAGEAAVFVDPYDVGSIARGLERLDHDPELRAALRESGPIQAQHFSSAAYLDRLRSLYDSLGLKGSSHG